MATEHDFDFPPWLKPLARAVGVRKWMRSNVRFSREFYFESIDDAISRRNAHQKETSDGVLASMIALIIEETGELRAHARREKVAPESEGEWADMTAAAGWAVVEQYRKDVAKGKWP
jgi:hypothetical protein